MDYGNRLKEILLRLADGDTSAAVEYARLALNEE